MSALVNLIVLETGIKEGQERKKRTYHMICIEGRLVMGEVGLDGGVPADS